MKARGNTHRAILLIEDSEANSLAQALSERGYIVLAAANEPTAIKAARSEGATPALLLINLERRTPTCLEMARRIHRRLMPEESLLVIVVADKEMTTLEIEQASLEKNEYLAYFKETEELDWFLRNIVLLN